MENMVKTRRARRIMNFTPKISLNFAYMTRKPDGIQLLLKKEHVKRITGVSEEVTSNHPVSILKALQRVGDRDKRCADNRCLERRK